MNSKKKVIVARWVDQVATRRHCEEVEGRGWFGLRVDRHGDLGVGDVDIARVASRRGEKWVVSLLTPPIGALHASRYLRGLLIQRGIPFYQIPWRSVSAADIMSETIEVVDVVSSESLFAFPHTLFRAQTRSRDRGKDGMAHRRTAYFLSGVDGQEWRESYFLCELPPGVEPTTVAEAYEALKPESVREAERLGLRVRRQGDIFAIEAPTFEPLGYIQELVHLHGSNHVADLATFQGGQVYARGRVRHRPIGRRPDHSTLRLGKRWHLIVQNTVPLAK